ncbi:OLC1v1037097C1 [Oldenlandia corymbosa var. corymbosa]|uniref:OLC1v1037097C1 n=1 Tax=Oldenlandia corymbosa var. corymbosa TaxID=529605 RepID=A0AAV1D050_OLDCO|nr:OLC1v1037097C1 [Oldenlandia corymbosa var. corymbosa]
MIARQLKLNTLYSRPIQVVRVVNYLRAFHNEGVLFDRIPQPSYGSSGHSMLDLVRANDKPKVLEIFKMQLQWGLSEIGEVEVALALKACRNYPNVGIQIHGFAVATGLISRVSVSNSLMNMYCKSGHFDRAFCIFNKLENPDTVSYNTLLSGFQDAEEALDFACHCHSMGVVFDAVSCTVCLSLSVGTENFCFGIQLHGLLLKLGLESELFVGNALVTLYSKWGKIMEAERAFCQIPSKDLVSWNAMISGYAQEGTYDFEAMLGFIQMVRESRKLDHVSLASVVSACGHERNLEFGRQVHCLIIKRGREKDVSVGNNLMSMYWKCDLVEEAKLVFGRMGDRDVVSCTTMISIDEEDAVNIFKNMRKEEVYPNEVTFVGLLRAITVKVMKLEGLMVHALCIKMNFLSNVNVANCFVTMYAKFESMMDSLKIFEELDDRETVSWNALISGYAQNGMYHDALETFLSASLEVQPNAYTFGSVLHAIGSSESVSLLYGQACHAYLLKLGLNFNPMVSGALLDMYAKRGNICESLKVFHEHGEKNQVAWTAIISAYSRHGDYESVMNLFDEMRDKGVKPDSITFLSVLTACGRKGMVDTGFQIFNSMLRDHSIDPSPEHYSCMVDMLGRAGRLKEAEKLMDQIPGGPGLSVLFSLLGSCRVYGNVDLASRLTDTLIEMEPNNSGSYVLMSNLFAEKGLWEKAAKMRKGMRNKGVKKEIGFSWVDAGSANDSLYMHGFSAGDKSHPKSEEIYEMAEGLGSEMMYVEEETETEIHCY